MKRCLILITFSVGLLHSIAIAQPSSVYSYQGPYVGGAPNQNQPGQEYQMQRQNQTVDPDFPQNAPSTQEERAFMQRSQSRYQQETEADLNMIQRDRAMIQRGYDPNETYNYSQRGDKGLTQFNNTYPMNNLGFQQTRLNDAEAELRGNEWNQQDQYHPAPFPNPFSDQQSNGNPSSQTHH